MKRTILKKLLSLLIILTLVFNNFSYYFVATKIFAQEVVLEATPTNIPAVTSSDTQEASPTPQASVENSSPKPAPVETSKPESLPASVPTETPEILPSATPTADPTPQPTAIPSILPDLTATPQPSLPTMIPPSTDSASATSAAGSIQTPSFLSESIPTSPWKDLGEKTFETTNNLQLNQEYIFPQNDKVKVLFTKLPSPSGNLTIKEVKLNPDQMITLHSLSDTAYEITSTMTDGTFEYDLTLPLPEQSKGKKIEVKSAETSGELNHAQTVSEPKEEKLDTITIKGLNHFTIFIVTTPEPDTAQRVLINEILPNPTAGAEWVELYNNGTVPVNLANGTGWTIRNSAGNTQSLSTLGTIAAAGRAVFNAPAGWLSDVAPETISLVNENGTTIDTVTISLTAPGFTIDRYPFIGESVGRKSDGVAEWMLFTTPTRETANIVFVVPGGSLVETGPVNPITGFPSWYKDSNGLALDLMEAADSFGISDPVDPANPFSEQIGFNAEGFWWSAEASIDRPIGTRTILVLAQEAAFAGEAAVDGEQSVQNRLRYRIDGLVPGETYTITHPFGAVDEVADEAGVINVTDDTGCFAGGGVTCNQTATPNFSTALSGQVGPFLTWTTFNTNPALTDPQLVNPANPGRRYVGNPAIEHAVTGSPTDNNLFRVEGLNVGGPGVNSIETNLFSVSGRLADANAPVITLFGANPVNAVQNLTYTDAGATAIDDLGGNLTGSILVSGLPVDTTTLGAKTVTYTVTDSVDRTAIATRAVNVVAAGGVDTTAPVITLVGTNPINVVSGTPYIDTGATALDDTDGDISTNIVTTNPVNTAVIGAYTVTYNVTDAAGNAATPVTRTVNVVADTILPVITVLGSNQVNILTGGTYSDAGATATDNVNGNVTANIVTTGLPIDTTIIRANTVTYTVTDSAGNTTSATRTVNVVATLPSGLATVSAINPDNGYPTWYKDSAGIALQLCLAEANGLADGNCVLPGAGEEPNFNPASPISFPNNFPGEAFWYLAEPDVVTNAGQTGQGRVRFRYALESAFTTEAPTVNEQIAFLRVNMQRIEDLVPGATYTVTHPFGQFTMHAGDALLEDGVTPNPDAGVADDGRFFRLEDGAFFPPLTEVTAASFLSAANTGISTFLKQVNPVPPAGYIGDGLTLSTIESGPNGNFVRVEGPSIDVNNYDGDGNPNSLTIDTWTVSGKLADVTAPVITLNGVTPVEVAQNAIYIDAGAAAVDDFDGNVTPNIITTGLPVDTSIAGAKTVTYTVTDRAGNTATATRTVNVGGSAADITAPVITILGANPVDVTVGTVYTDAGATALDNVDGNLTANIVATGLPVNTSVVGTFTVTYSVADAAGNLAGATRTVNVVAAAPIVDTAAPNLLSFSSTTTDGAFGPGSNINITAVFSEPLAAGSSLVVTLNTGATTTLNTVSGNSINGTYTVGAVGSGENTTALAVSAITSSNVSDIAGNAQASTVLPVSNISTLSTIIVSTIAVTPAPAPVSGTITVITDAVPNDPQDFGFRLRGGLLDENFSLDDDGNNTNELSDRKVFSDLASGSYSLSENSASNWVLDISCQDPDNGTTVAVNARSSTVELDAGENITCTFTNSLRRTITGVTFDDLNGNSTMDNGEEALAGWTVYIDTNDNKILDPGEISAISDVNGNYQFADLGGGTYSVREILQDGWIQTTPTDGKYNVVVTSNSGLINLHYGNFKKVSITGSLWKDLNADKIWGSLEPGLGGWDITLSKVTPSLITLPISGSLAGETVTIEQIIKTATGSGAFSFIVDKPGQYRVSTNQFIGWQQTTPADSFFNILVSRSGQVITTDKNGKELAFGTTPFYSVSNQGKFVSASGLGGITSSVISLGSSILTLDGNGGTNTIIIPDGTIISRVDGIDFDISQLQTAIPALSFITGLETGLIAKGLLQWGIPNIGLQFSSPITLNIYVGTDLNGQTLDVMRSVTGSAGWINDGIVAPATCLVSSGICSFQTTKASYFAAIEPVTRNILASTTSSSSNTSSSSTVSNSSSGSGSSSSSNSNGNSGGSVSTPVCADTKPGGAPTLLSAIATGNNQITLNWSKALNPVTYYLIAYGTSPDSLQFGNPNVGNAETTSYTINNLSGGITYYFKVRAVNNCMPGDFSNELNATALGEIKTETPEGFSNMVLGEKENNSNKNINSEKLHTKPLQLASLLKNFQLNLTDGKVSSATIILGILTILFFANKKIKRKNVY